MRSTLAFDLLAIGGKEHAHMNLTETIQKAIEAETTQREQTAAEKKAVEDFVSECRKANPYTRCFFNATKQIQLSIVATDVAAELKDAARYEGIDDARANPGLGDGKKGGAA